MRAGKVVAPAQVIQAAAGPNVFGCWGGDAHGRQAAAFRLALARGAILEVEVLEGGQTELVACTRRHRRERVTRWGLRRMVRGRHVRQNARSDAILLLPNKWDLGSGSRHMSELINDMKHTGQTVSKAGQGPDAGKKGTKVGWESYWRIFGILERTDEEEKKDSRANRCEGWICT